jgi:hypothetical protein
MIYQVDKTQVDVKKIDSEPTLNDGEMWKATRDGLNTAGFKVKKVGYGDSPDNALLACLNA